MEIQAFFLAETVTQDGNRHDVRRAVLSRIECNDQARFPTRFALPALIVLRQENTASDSPIRLRFTLVDEDGRPTGRPRGLIVKGVFPARNRFYYLMAKLDFEFPSPGKYRLDVTADDELHNSVYHYAIDILPAGVV